MLIGSTLLLLFCCRCEGAVFEWAGTFDTPGDAYVWTAQAVDGEYVDPGMKMVVMPTTSSTGDLLTTLESEADARLSGPCRDTEVGATITPAEDVCYQLRFNALMHTSIFAINATAAGHLAIFAEHFPIEFERDMHYLKDPAGGDVEPVAEFPEAEATAKPWGVALGAAVLVNLCTFIGVLFIAPPVARAAQKHLRVLFALSNAFAAGALLAAAFFLMFYEATHLIPITEERPEAMACATWGTLIIVGYLTPFLCGLPFSAFNEYVKAPSAPAKAEGDIHIELKPPSNKRSRVLSGILLGDFIHNFVDGIFIGVGFYSCNDSVGWSITAATIYHELAQEISDYFVLTDPEQGALKPSQALGINFLSGTSVILGVVTLLAQGEIPNDSLGPLLAFGGGIYLSIAGTECMPKALEAARSTVLQLLVFLLFSVGAIGIGLVLLDHEHCSAGGGGHAH